MSIAASVKNGLIVLASIIGTLVASDLLLRSIGYLPRLEHEWLLNKAESRVPDDQLILIKPKMLEEDYYRADPDLETVVTIGDSFVTGYPVKTEDSYPAVLARILDERDHPVNLLNMGIGDSGPDQHLRLMKAYVLPRLTPDIVIWSFYANDIFDNVSKAVYDIENDTLVPLDASRHPLHIRHKIYMNIPLPGSVKESSPVLRALFRALQVLGNRDMHPSVSSRAAWGVDKIHLEISEMERLAQTYGFRVLYVLIAPQAIYLRERDPARWGKDSHVAAYSDLRRVLMDQVPFIDVRFRDVETQICGSTIETPAWNGLFTGERRDNNRLGDRHFNEAGYSLLAEMVAACILNGTS